MQTIHAPGSTQPYGVFLAVKEPELRITHISENCQKVFGVGYQGLLENNLSSLFAPQDFNTLRSNLGSQNFQMINPLRLSVNNKPYDLILHRNPTHLVIEFEPVAPGAESNVDMYRRLAQESIGKIMATQTTNELIRTTVDQIRQVSGFDRVMLYRYDEHYNGEVIGESLSPGTSSYFGQRFPGWETPAPIRELYAKNPCRYIPHVFHVPSKVLSNDPKPLDMTYAQLRSCPDCHLQYMHNMGVSSTMSFPVVINNKLWALIACHSIRPREITYTQRIICSQVAQVFPELLKAKEQPQVYQGKVNQLRDRILSQVRTSTHVVQGLVACQQDLLEMACADGFAIYFQGQITTVGRTPGQQEIQKVLGALCDQYNGLVYKEDPQGLIYTSSISKYLKRYAPSTNGLAEALVPNASGMLIIPISRSRQDYLLFFRTEQPTECVWGGNPDRALLFADKFNINSLSPRSAFDAWKQLVRGTSIPWIPFEVEAARSLRDNLVQLN
jgi:chemotaxis family two-component system sensor kinase Cph1